MNLSTFCKKNMTDVTAIAVCTAVIVGFGSGCGGSATQTTQQVQTLPYAQPILEVTATEIPDGQWVATGRALPSHNGPFVDAWWDGTAYWLVAKDDAIIYRQSSEDSTSWQVQADLSGAVWR